MGLNFITMTKTDFLMICNDHGIAPEIVLEDRAVLKILREPVNSIHQDLLQQMQLSAYLKENF